MIRDLGDGLVLRRATVDDEEPLAAFVGSVLRAQDGDEPNPHMTAWTRDLIGGRHPSFRPGDATVVVDDRTGAIVSCLRPPRRPLPQGPVRRLAGDLSVRPTHDPTHAAGGEGVEARRVRERATATGEPCGRGRAHASGQPRHRPPARDVASRRARRQVSRVTCAPGRRVRAWGAMRILEERLPLPRIAQSSAMTCSST